MRLLTILTLALCTTASAQGLRQEFRRDFKAGAPIKGKNFTITPFNGDPSHVAETWFTIEFTDRTIDYVILEVFYIWPPSSVGYRPDLLLHKTVVTPVLYGAATGTEIVPLSVWEIKMIRVTGLHEQSKEDIR